MYPMSTCAFLAFHPTADWRALYQKIRFLKITQDDFHTQIDNCDAISALEKSTISECISLHNKYNNMPTGFCARRQSRCERVTPVFAESIQCHHIYRGEDITISLPAILIRTTNTSDTYDLIFKYSSNNYYDHDAAPDLVALSFKFGKVANLFPLLNIGQMICPENGPIGKRSKIRTDLCRVTITLPEALRWISLGRYIMRMWNG